MGGKGKFRRDTQLIYGGPHHVPKTPSSSQQKTREDLCQNIKKTPVCAVECMSKIFGPIRLKEIRDSKYSANDIKNFFFALDHSGVISVTVRGNNYVDKDSVFTVNLGPDRYILPVSIFWYCLSQDIRDRFKHHGDFYVIYFNLLSFYNIKLISRTNR